MSAFEEYLARQSTRVERALRRYGAARRLGSAVAEAEQYSLYAGGKRLRPVLVIAAAEACGGDAEKVLPAACALEMIHTYSLIHDDLPAMDDDDLRRGRPTNHKVFGEAMAILAGDGLLTRAFGLAAETAALGVPAERVCEAVRVIAEAAGGPGMVGGQALDLRASERQGDGASSSLTRPQRAALLRDIHRMKTAALITASLETGAVLSGATKAQRKALRDFGQAAGLSFQIVDDILDRVGDKAKLGKSGSDLENGKLTYPAVFGIEAARAEAARLTRRAHNALKPLGPAARPLHDLADFILSRDR